MATQAVKFHMANAPVTAAKLSTWSTLTGDLFFVNNGELYKGSERFGANKVIVLTTEEGEGKFATVEAVKTAHTDKKISLMSGDMVIGDKFTKVWNGTDFVDIPHPDFPTLSVDAENGTIQLGEGEAQTIPGFSAANSAMALLSSIATVDEDGNVTLTADSATFGELNIGDDSISDLISSIADSRISAKIDDEITEEGTGLVTASTIAGYVASQIEALGAMEFKGVLGEGEAHIDETTGLLEVTKEGYIPENGDIYIYNGTQYVYSDSTGENGQWIQLGAGEATTGAITALQNQVGDPETYPLNDTGVIAGAGNLTDAINKVAAAYDAAFATDEDGKTTIKADDFVIKNGGEEKVQLTDDEKEGVEFREGDGWYKVEGEGEEKTETKIGDENGNKIDPETGRYVTQPVDKSLEDYINEKVELPTIVQEIAKTDASEEKLASEKAIRDAIDSAQMVWLDEAGNALNS